MMTTLNTEMVLDLAIAAAQALREEIADHKITKAQLIVALEDLRQQETRPAQDPEGPTLGGMMYYTGRPCTTQAEHNRQSWSYVEGCLLHAPQSMSTLCEAIGDHPAPGGAKGFVKYCLKNGWLVEVAG